MHECRGQPQNCHLVLFWLTHSSQIINNSGTPWIEGIQEFWSDITVNWSPVVCMWQFYSVTLRSLWNLIKSIYLPIQEAESQAKICRKIILVWWVYMKYFHDQTLFIRPCLCQMSALNHCCDVLPIVSESCCTVIQKGSVVYTLSCVISWLLQTPDDRCFFSWSIYIWDKSMQIPEAVPNCSLVPCKY